MAERAKTDRGSPFYGRDEASGPAAGRTQLSWLLSRESLLRLMLSFVLAIALWLYVTGKQSAPVVYDAPLLFPVTFQGLNSNYVVNGDPIDVRLRVTLDSNANPLLYNGSFRPYVDLTGFRAGYYAHVPIHVQRDPGVRAVQSVPSNIPVRIEVLKEASIPVYYVAQRQPPAGYHARVTIQPGTVRIAGPASLVNQVHRAVVHLNLSTYNFNSAYPFDLVNTQGQPVRGHFAQNSPDPAEVQVSAQVTPPASSKTVPVVVPSLRGQARAGYGVVNLQVTPYEILAHGTAERLNQLTSVSTAPISIARRGAGSFVARVPISLPSGISSATRTARVRVTLAPVNATTSIPVALTFTNVGSGLIASSRPGSVLVTVLGPSGTVRNLVEHVTATINVYGYGVGTFLLKPAVSAPAHYEVKAVYPSAVSVTIASR